MFFTVEYQFVLILELVEFRVYKSKDELLLDSL